jgi:hypothetical protein
MAEHERYRAEHQRHVEEHDRDTKKLRELVAFATHNLDALIKSRQRPQDGNPLRAISDEDLLAEVKRRGLDRLGLKWRDA